MPPSTRSAGAATGIPPSMRSPPPPRPARAASTSTSRPRRRSSASSCKTTADRLAIKVERAVAEQTDPIARADAALRTVLLTFAGHRTMARLLFVDAMGAGRVFNAETNALHDRFAGMIAGYLDDAVAAGAIPPIDTAPHRRRLVRGAQRGRRPVAAGRRSGPPRDGLPDAAGPPPAERRGRRGADRGTARARRMTVTDRTTRPRTAPASGQTAPVAREVRALLAAADRRGGPRPLLTTTLPIDALDPIELFAAARAQGLEAALWLQPRSDRSIVGIGRAWAIEPDGSRPVHDRDRRLAVCPRRAPSCPAVRPTTAKPVRRSSAVLASAAGHRDRTIPGRRSERPRSSCRRSVSPAEAGRPA